MSTHDLSRYLLQPAKHYASVRMQQGRVVLDSDWNEGENIDDEETRRSLVEIVGPSGSPNEGFLVEVPSAASLTPFEEGASAIDTYDFGYRPGSIYLGGLRFEAEEGEHFLKAQDWLRIDSDDAFLPPYPSVAELQALPGRERHDLVYLEGWEQAVSSVEDAELRERALGGPDTSTRLRRMRRVAVQSRVPGSCSEAFDALIERLRAPRDPDSGAAHDFDRASFELRSKCRLSVGLDPEALVADPCKPAAVRGYVGADNQSIRIELTAPGRFLWGLDNASPLYRVQLEQVEGEYRKVRFLTPPLDQAAQPLMGQAVEILPWGALLPNGEKVAEVQGHLSTVSSSYDPEERCILLGRALPQAWVDWLAAHSEWQSERDPEEERQYFYLRLWTGGSGVEDEDPSLPFTPGATLALGQSGLTLRFSDYGLPGDHWVIAARPHTPDLVVPWELLEAAAPFGYRRFYAPLALITWFLEGEEVRARVHDCRRPFQPLTQLRGCCTLRVGDGETSFGDTTSIQEAIDRLPASGGKICLLPGIYRERVRIENRRNITLEGCGKRSVLRNPEGELGLRIDGDEPRPLIAITSGEDICLRDFAVEATGLFGIQVDRGAQRVRLESLEMSARGSEGEVDIIPMSAIDVLWARGLEIDRCTLQMQGLASPYPALYLRGLALALRRSRILTGPEWPTPNLPFIDGAEAPEEREPVLAWGGVQVASLSVDVLLCDNEILGGAGHGITLGSVRYVPEGREPIEDLRARPWGGEGRYAVGWWFGRWRRSLCLEWDPFPPDISVPDGPTLVPRPEGNIAGLRILRNRIAYHEASGISVAAFFPLNLAEVFYDPLDDALLGDRFEPDLLGIEDAIIAGNDIGLNMLSRPSASTRGSVLDALYGGIALALATNLDVRENRIYSNGTRHATAIAGIGVLVGQDVVVQDNRITGNGASAPQRSFSPGLRGGIVVRIAFRSIDSQAFDLPGDGPDLELPRFRDAALQISGNAVYQPSGKALWIDLAFGPLRIQNNLFETYADDRAARADGRVPLHFSNLRLSFGSHRQPAPGVCVHVFDFGLPRDLGYSSAPLYLWLEILGLLDGRVSFDGNQTSTRLSAIGGIGSALFLTTLDALSFQQNQCSAALGGAVETRSINSFFTRILRNDAELATRSFGLYHVVAAATSVQASHNRIAEGWSDFASSMLTYANNESFGPIAVFNQATHCIYAVPPSSAELIGNRILLPYGKCSQENRAEEPGVWGVQAIGGAG